MSVSVATFFCLLSHLTAMHRGVKLVHMSEPPRIPILDMITHAYQMTYLDPKCSYSKVRHW